MTALRTAAKAIEEVCGKADVAVVLGSGLGDYVEALENPKSIAYKDIPGFPVSTAPGHAGRWYTGSLHGKRVCMMQGRFHGYEGYDMAQVTMPVRVMKLLGVKTLIVTNAAGGVNTSFAPGDLMLMTDFINLSGKNPLIGPNLDEFGPRFPDMCHAYDQKLQSLTADVASKLGIGLQKGVYCWLNGPCYETPAEIRMVRTLGADAVGMSTVPETIVARQSGMEVLGLSCITNMAAGILDQPLSHQEVMETGARVKDTFRALVDGVIDSL
ncbi:MAG: purine-nucleoside phosphorylase [Eubacteriales bacterium]|nr:purine-nucleoside phosphorylase [Eubacteriales bacterium]